MSDISQMLTRPLVWLAMAVFAALLSAQALYVTSLSRGVNAAGGAARIGLIMFGISVMLILARMVFRFALSRQLGSADGSAGEARVGYFILFTIGYESAFGLVAGFAPLLLVQLAPSPWVYGPAQNSLRAVLALVLFPLAVRIVALAHNGNAIRLNVITAMLGARWYAVLAALLVGLALVQMAVGMAAAVAGTGAAIAGALIGGISQVLLMLYVIAAYRYVDRAYLGDADIFS